VQRVTVLPELKELSPSALRARTREVLFSGDRWRDFAREAVLETDAPPREIALRGEGAGPGKVRVVCDEPQRLELEVDLAAPGLLVVRDYHDDQWRACYSAEGEKPQPVAVLRTNRVFRGVWLPAGRGKVLWQYRPRSVLMGGIVSGCAWAVLGIFVITVMTGNKLCRLFGLNLPCSR
jgi:hypothetical protein